MTDEICCSSYNTIEASGEIQGDGNAATGKSKFSGQIEASSEDTNKGQINERDLSPLMLTSEPIIHASLPTESTEADGSFTLSFSCKSSSSLDRNDCQSTPRTPISEILIYPNSEDVSPEKHATKSKQTQDSFLLDLSICNDVLFEQDVPAQNSTDVGIESNAINLDKVDAEPSPQINHSLKQVDAIFENVLSPTKKADSSSYLCMTEATPISSIRLHQVCGKRCHNTIYRWKRGSEITFNVDRHSFRSNTEYARIANETLDAAVEQWNKGRFGVRFKRVEDHKEAVFQLIYSAGGGDVLATAFFPNTTPIGRRLVVYEQAFIEVNGRYDLMTNIFCHELGHILGLRHERAHEKEAGYPSVQWGGSNPLSIMNDDLTPDEFSIHEDDYVQVKDFYESCATYNKYTIVDVDAKPCAIYFCRCPHCRNA